MYTFKAWQEIGWAVLIAVVIQAAQIIVTSDLETVTDWRAWIISLLAACLRAAVAIVLTKLTGPKTET
jgi:hypothetical protein